MFKVGDVVRYCQSGVCKIANIEQIDFSGEKKDYYILSPIRKPNSTVYVPSDNSDLVKKMVPVLSPEEIDSIVSEAIKEHIEWIKDFRKRCEKAKSVLASENRKDVLLLIKSIYEHKKELSTEGKYMHTSDDYILKDAEELVFGEIAFSLNKEYKDVESYLRETLGA